MARLDHHNLGWERRYHTLIKRHNGCGAPRTANHGPLSLPSTSDDASDDWGFSTRTVFAQLTIISPRVDCGNHPMFRWTALRLSLVMARLEKLYCASQAPLSNFFSSSGGGMADSSHTHHPPGRGVCGGTGAKPPAHVVCCYPCYLEWVAITAWRLHAHAPRRNPLSYLG
jgi:hypothetical protein